MEATRKLNFGLIVLAVIASAAIAYVSIEWLFQSEFIASIQSITFGLVNGTLMANALQMVVVIGFILMFLGKARLASILSWAEAEC